MLKNIEIYQNFLFENFHRYNASLLLENHLALCTLFMYFRSIVLGDFRLLRSCTQDI